MNIRPLGIWTKCSLRLKDPIDKQRAQRMDSSIDAATVCSQRTFVGIILKRSLTWRLPSVSIETIELFPPSFQRSSFVTTSPKDVVYQNCERGTEDLTVPITWRHYMVGGLDLWEACMKFVFSLEGFYASALRNTLIRDRFPEPILRTMMYRKISFIELGLHLVFHEQFR
jgi:hypothetical protein